MEEPIAKRLRNARKGEIDLTPLSNRIRELLEQRNESLRAAGLKAVLVTLNFSMILYLKYVDCKRMKQSI
jgi:hypothetical protein